MATARHSQLTQSRFRTGVRYPIGCHSVDGSAPEQQTCSTPRRSAQVGLIGQNGTAADPGDASSRPLRVGVLLPGAVESNHNCPGIAHYGDGPRDMREGRRPHIEGRCRCSGSHVAQVLQDLYDVPSRAIPGVTRVWNRLDLRVHLTFQASATVRTLAARVVAPTWRPRGGRQRLRTRQVDLLGGNVQP